MRTSTVSSRRQHRPAHSAERPFGALVLVIFIALLCAEASADALSAKRAPTWVVNSDSDQHASARHLPCTKEHCTLRAAIDAANRSGHGGRIHFALPGAPYRIDLQQPLPAVGSDVVIDGATQDGTTCPLPSVQLSGAQIVADRPVDGLVIAGNRSIVRGLVIRRFSGHGVRIHGDHNAATCLFVGTDATGTEPSGNGGHGIAVTGGISNQIGGPSPAQANLLSANGGYGLYVEDALGITRQHNFIGVNVFDEPALPNGNQPSGRLNPEPAPSKLSPERTALIQQWLTRYLDGLLRRDARALERAGLVQRYTRLLQSDTDRRRAPGTAPRTPPRTIGELIAQLTNEPQLYAAFTQEAQQIIQRTNARSAIQIGRVTGLLQRVVPALGRDAENQPEERRDLTNELVAGLASDSISVSGSPSLVRAVNIDDLIDLSPLRFHSLETYGPLQFSSTIAGTPGNSPNVRTCTSLTTPCFWPISYDFLPHSAQLLWQSISLTQQQIDDIVQENDYFLELFVNGQLLRKGPPVGTSNPDPIVEQLKSYDAVGFDGEPCPAGRRCIATTLLTRKTLKHIPKPWHFVLKVRRLSELANPIIDGIDENGNFIFKTHQAELISESSVVVEPQPVNGHLKWFDEALVDTFKHPRCADCHGFEDFAGLALHHGYQNTSSFVDSTSLHLEPSAYVPGAHVMACQNCHILSPTDSQGHPFHEFDWVAPYFDLDINWSQKTSSQICEKVKQTLPTKDLRHEHFHGDARLFWAVEYPIVPGNFLPTAPPSDFAEFLRRIDVWNYFGAPCP